MATVSMSMTLVAADLSRLSLSLSLSHPSSTTTSSSSTSTTHFPTRRPNLHPLNSTFLGQPLLSYPPLPSSSSQHHHLSSSSLRGVVGMGAMEAGIGMMGTKMGMFTYFYPDGKATAVTVVGFHEGNIVTQLKTDRTDGYNAVQVGYKRLRERKLTKPELGHLQKAGAIPMRHLQEFRLVDVEGFEPGQRLSLEELFKEGDLVDVSGNSIGKGFAGGIKRHNFRRGAMAHGSKSHRELGSIGAGTTPGRVYPGKKMPGRLGGKKTKIRKLEVVRVDPELRTLLIKGAVPGKAGNLLRITPAKIVGKNIPKS